MAVKKSRSSAVVCGESAACGVFDAPEAELVWAPAEIVCANSTDENIALKMTARRRPAIHFIFIYDLRTTIYELRRAAVPLLALTAALPAGEAFSRTTIRAAPVKQAVTVVADRDGGSASCTRPHAPPSFIVMVGGVLYQAPRSPRPKILMEGGRPLARPHAPPIRALPRSLAAMLRSLCGIVGTIGHRWAVL